MHMTTERYFLTYSGVQLPLQLVTELTPDDIRNRNTYFTATYDEHGRLTRCCKMIYGEVDLEHRYVYRSDGTLSEARIADMDDGDEEVQVLHFDETGAPTRTATIE